MIIICYYISQRGRLLDYHHSPPIVAVFNSSMTAFSSPSQSDLNSGSDHCSCWGWTFYTPIRRPPLAPAAVKLHDSSLLSPNSASHSDHVGLPNLVLPQELLVFPASLNVLVSRVSWRLWSWFVLQDVMVTQLDCGKSEVKIYSNYHNCMPILFLCRWSGSPDFTHALIHANFTAILRTSSLFPSPPTHDTLTSSSPHPRKPSSQYLPSLPQFSPTKE